MQEIDPEHFPVVTPFLVCICGNFKADEKCDLSRRIKCKNCNGWMVMKHSH